MSPAELRASQEADLSLVLGPYLGIAAVLALIWLAIFFRKMSTPQEAHPDTGRARAGAFGRLWRNRHYRYGVAAQFFNVAAQVCAWTFTIQYALDVVGVPTESAGWSLQASLILFLFSRFLMTYLLGKFRPTRLLFLMGSLGVGFCIVAMFFQNMIGLVAVVMISLSLSLMFPTIYGVALQGLGEDTKFGAAGLVMAILGGALLPPVQGLIMDEWGTALAFVVPGICLALVTLYALFDLRTNRQGGALVVEGAH
jgi:FHS family L-fucose permease-like MFS transporter